MAVYTVQSPDGKILTIEGPEGASQEDVIKQAQQLYMPSAAAQADKQAAQEVSSFDYIANQAKLGLTDAASLSKALVDTFLVDPVKTAYAAVTGGEGVKGSVTERFGKNLKQAQEKTAQAVTADREMKSPGLLTSIVGGGARAITDPLGYVGAPLKAGQAVARAGGLFAVGTAAETGGELGATTEKAITGEDTGTGRMIGSIAGAVKGAPLAAAGVGAIGSGANAAKQIYDKYKQVRIDPDAAEQAYASGAAKRLLELVAKEQPTANLESIVQEYNKIGAQVIGGDLPLMVSMADNPVVRQQVIRLAKTNPEFRQRVNTELQNLAGALDQRAETIFGQRYAQLPESAPISLKNAVKRREAIDTQLEDIAGRFAGVDTTEQGQAIANLVKAREVAARQEISPEYDAVIAAARKAGAKLPEEDVANIYNFVVANNVRDIFGKGTPLDKRIMSALQPDATGFAPMSFDNVESLKRSINELQRTVKDPQQLLKINQLEEVLNAGRQNIKGNYSEQLAAVDRKFYEKVGVPFSEQGIKEIDSKKYAEQVAPVIAKNASATRQFLNVAGEAGQPIVRNSVIAEAYKSAVTPDGVLNPRALQKYIKDKSNVIEQVPGLRDELNAAIVDDGALRLARKKIDDDLLAANKRIADNIFPQLGMSKEAPDYATVVSRMVRDPAYRSKVFKNIKDLDPASSKAVRRVLQAELVETARNSTSGAVEFLSNPRNKELADQLFGAGYSKAAMDISKLSDKLAAADITRVGAVVEQQELDALAKIVPGLDIPYVTSTIRDRISSLPQKIVRIATRMNTARTKDATDEAIAELMLDPQGMNKLAQVTKTLDLSIKNPVQFKKIKDTFADVLPKYFYIGSKIGAEAPQQEQPVMPEFGGFVQ